MYLAHTIYVPTISRKPVPPASIEGNHKDKYNEKKGDAVDFQLVAIDCQGSEHEAHPTGVNKKMRELIWCQGVSASRTKCQGDTDRGLRREYISHRVPLATLWYSCAHPI